MKTPNIFRANFNLASSAFWKESSKLFSILLALILQIFLASISFLSLLREDFPLCSKLFILWTGVLLALLFIFVLPPSSKAITVLHEYGHYNYIYFNICKSERFDYMLRKSKSYNFLNILHTYDGKIFHSALKHLSNNQHITNLANSGTLFICVLCLIVTLLSSALICSLNSNNNFHISVILYLLITIVTAIATIEVLIYFFSSKNPTSDYYISKYPWKFEYVENKKDYDKSINFNWVCSVSISVCLFVFAAFICFFFYNLCL